MRPACRPAWCVLESVSDRQAKPGLESVSDVVHRRTEFGVMNCQTIELTVKLRDARNVKLIFC